jgi:competence protein ComEC
VLETGWTPDPNPTARRPLLPAHATEVRLEGALLDGCGGAVRVRLPRGSAAADAGTVVELAGRWTRLPNPVLGSRWPRDADGYGYLAADSLAVAAPPSWAAHPLLAARGGAERRLGRLMGRHAPLAHALLLGRRETLDREVRERFARAGLVHLLAISGTHVGLIGAVFVLLGRMARLSRRRVAWTTILLIAAYLAVIGAPPSAIRAGIMLSLALLAGTLQRPTAPLAVVAAAAFALLAAQPMAALDIGFQLSFAGALGILLLRKPLLRLAPPKLLRTAPGRWSADALAVSVAAFVVTAPPVAWHFGVASPVSILASVPAVPVTGFALVGIGAAAAVEPVWPALARLVADGAGAGLDVLDRIVDLSLRVPGGHAAVGRPLWWAWGAAGLVLLLALDAGARWRAPVRRAVAAMAAAGAWLLLPLAAGAVDGGLEIAFLDVGQGDAAAIRTPAGRWLLVDAGMRDASWDAGERRVLPFLRARGARRIEAIVLTHPHADHIGGAAAVIGALPVGRLVEPGVPTGSGVYLQTLETAAARGVAWSAARADRKLLIDGVELLFLWPTPDVLDAPEDLNDLSAVTMVRYGAFSALLTGDAPAWVEERIAARHGPAVRADVLKAGHHGSHTSTSAAFLDAVDPELVVVSTGARNRYGHPHPEVLRRLEARGVAVARTDREGTVRILVEPGGGAWRRAP